MATINKTIASSGADYTSMSLFEASIPGSGSDDYVGTYIEALSDTTLLTCTFGASNTMTIEVQSAYRANGAVAGTHAELVADPNGGLAAIEMGACGAVTIRNLRIVHAGANSNFEICVYHTGAAPVTIDRCTLVHRSTGAAGGYALYDNPSDVAGVMTVSGCFIVDSGRSDAAIGSVIFLTNSRAKFYRNSLFVPDGTALCGVRVAVGTCDARENVVLKAVGTTCADMYLADLGGSFTGDSTHNVSSDATAPGASPMTNKAAADYLTTLTVGSENLHYPDRATMLGLTAGSDLSATVGTVDIDGDAINVWYPGADYVNAVPTLSGVSPDNGPVAGGTSVTLTGTNFTDVTGVTFGGDAATNVSVVSDTSITCDTPAHAAGAVSVLATNADGSNTANSAYTYNAAAVLAALGSAVRLRFGDLGFGRR